MKATPAHQALLMQLQKLDTEIAQLNFKLKNMPEHEQIAAIHTRMENTAVELKVVELELEDVTIDLRRSEVDVEAVTSRREKDEKRLSAGLGTPKELEQLQHEIETLNKRQAELEDGELEIMERHEGVKKRFDELKNDQVGLEKLELELNIRIENAKTEIDALIATAAADRMKLAPQIDTALVELYEKIRSGNGGVGAALLIGNKCDGCHLQINAIEVERIKTLADDDVLRCEECRRILVRI
jgi:predicted  nucleic acid-binding Zn-ribbon protein